MIPLTAPQGGDGGDKETRNTNRVHGAVGPGQVQVDQAVGLGQEQVEVLEGEKDGAFIGGVDRSVPTAMLIPKLMAKNGPTRVY